MPTHFGVSPYSHYPHNDLISRPLLVVVHILGIRMIYSTQLPEDYLNEPRETPYEDEYTEMHT